MNPLDCFFWSYAMMHERRVKPASIQELMEVVEDVARKSVANIGKRC